MHYWLKATKTGGLPWPRMSDASPDSGIPHHIWIIVLYQAELCVLIMKCCNRWSNSAIHESCRTAQLVAQRDHISLCPTTTCFVTVMARIDGVQTTSAPDLGDAVQPLWSWSTEYHNLLSWPNIGLSYRILKEYGCQMYWSTCMLASSSL